MMTLALLLNSSFIYLFPWSFCATSRHRKAWNLLFDLLFYLLFMSSFICLFITRVSL